MYKFDHSRAHVSIWIRLLLILVASRSDSVITTGRRSQCGFVVSGGCVRVVGDGRGTRFGETFLHDSNDGGGVSLENTLLVELVDGCVTEEGQDGLGVLRIKLAEIGNVEGDGVLLVHVVQGVVEEREQVLLALCYDALVIDIEGVLHNDKYFDLMDT